MEAPRPLRLERWGRDLPQRTGHVASWPISPYRFLPSPCWLHPRPAPLSSTTQARGMSTKCKTLPASTAVGGSQLPPMPRCSVPK